MSVFTLDLDEAEREALEAHRIRLGCRSGAETIRALLLANPVLVRHEWIDPNASGIAQPRSPDGDPSLTGAYRKGAPGYVGESISVPTLSRPAFNPQPKPQKGKK